MLILTTGKSQTGESFIIQIDSKTSIEKIHEYFNEKNINISSRLIAPSIGAYLIHPRPIMRRSTGWEALFDDCPDIQAWQFNRTYDQRSRSEERRVGKEWRSRSAARKDQKKQR